MTTFTSPLIGFAADGILFETADGMAILNRAPQPGEVQVPVASHVEFDLSTTSGTVTLASTQVWIDGVLAFDAGVFQTGFDGAASTYGNPQVDVLRVRIDSTVDFEPLAIKTVRVVSASSAGGSIDTSWQFVVEDLVAPEVVTAQARDQFTVRVTFDEPIKLVDSANVDDGLRVANYSISLESSSLDDGLPAVGVSIVSVSAVSDSIVDLTLDWEMTPGAIYRVTVANVEDVFDNLINPGANSATFLGFALPFPAGRRFEMLDCIPEANRVEDTSRDLEAFIKSLQEPLDHLLYAVDRWTDILDPDRAPEAFVDAMLVDLGNPFGFDFELNEKRKLLTLLVPIYKKKGTRPGIIDAIRLLLGIEVTIEVPAFDDIWTLNLTTSQLGFNSYLGSGNAANYYTFFVVSPIALTDTQRSQITAIANYMKAAAEHLGGINEPSVPIVPDHLELGLSELGINWTLH